MALKGITGGVYQPLSSADIETIHQASLTILGNTGDDWEQDGSRDAATRAREIARTILAQEEKSCIPSDVAQAIREKYNIIIK